MWLPLRGVSGQDFLRDLENWDHLSRVRHFRSVVLSPLEDSQSACKNIALHLVTSNSFASAPLSVFKNLYLWTSGYFRGTQSAFGRISRQTADVGLRMLWISALYTITLLVGLGYFAVTDTLVELVTFLCEDPQYYPEILAYCHTFSVEMLKAPMEPVAFRQLKQDVNDGRLVTLFHGMLKCGSDQCRLSRG